jgi:hypothetical protein
MNTDTYMRGRFDRPIAVRTTVLMALLTLAPVAVLADKGIPVKGSASVSAIVPSATDYCASGGTPIEAQGVADLSGLGPVYVTVKKCLTFPNGLPVGTWTGTLTLRDASGDTVTAAYTAQEDFSKTDSNGFTPGRGTARITEGTGNLAGASGLLSFTFVQCPSAAAADSKAIVAAVYYLVDGNVTLDEKH